MARIFHVVTMLEMGGAQWNTLLAAAEAGRRGHAAAVVAAEGPLSGEARRRAAEGLIEFIPFPNLVREVRLWRDAAALRRLEDLFRRRRPEIVHTHSSKAGFLGRLAARRAGVPVVVHTAHGWGFHDAQPWPVRAAFVAAERLAARWADAIVAVAEATRAKGLAHRVGRPEQYAIIRSGIDVAGVRAHGDRAAARRALGIPHGAPVVATVGNLKPQKAPLDFVAVARRVASRFPDAVFLYAGDGVLRPVVERAIARAGLDGRVRLLGWRPDAPRVIAAADVFVLTSRWEGLPRAYLEAAALGVPAVGTDVDGAREIVEENVTGHLRPPGDVEGLAEAVCGLLADPARRRAFGEAAAARVAPAFDLAKMFDDLDALYARLAAAKGVRYP